MDQSPERGGLSIAIVIGALVVPSVAIGIRIAVWSGSVVVAVGAIALLAGGMYLLILYLRSRVEAQLSAIESTGSFEIEASLDFSCLPEPWPEKARETLNPAGAGQTPALPVTLAAHDGTLHIIKKQSWGTGRRPFHAEVPLSEIASVSVGRSRLGLVGSGLAMELRGGGAVQADLHLSRDRAEVVAEHLRAKIPRSTFAPVEPAVGVVVTSVDPPLRTSPARAGGLLMVTMAPFAVAMLGGPEGPLAATTSLLLVFFALWGQMRRPPTLNRMLAVGFVVTSLAFAVDAATSGEVWRLVGTAVCLALAKHLREMSPPSW